MKADLLAEIANVIPQDSGAWHDDLLALGPTARGGLWAPGAVRRAARVFNPVTRMKLVELVFPTQASEETRARAAALCETFEKTAVVVPDIPGFVVNRLLFPYLFSAVRLQEETGMEAADIDTCMKLGAGHPMGPLALLDLVGLDVSKAIGQEIGSEIPPRIDALIEEKAIGRKTGKGFHVYDR